MKLLISLLFFILFCSADPYANLHWGHNLQNTNYYLQPSNIKTCNVNQLQFVCNLTLNGPFETAYPTIENNVAYFGDFGGYVYSYNIATCNLLWSIFLPNITGINGAISAAQGFSGSMTRVTPAKEPEDYHLVITDYNSGYIICLNANNGALIWKNLVETTILARMAQSPVIHNHIIYVGTDSIQEAAPLIFGPSFVYTFRGSFMALDLYTGNIIWRTYLAPQNYSGNGLWSSAPSIDVERNAVYVATGNTYNYPISVATCLNTTGNVSCVDPNNFSDSIVALDLTTGSVLWTANFAGRYGIDGFNLACNYGLPGCQALPGDPEDSDLGQGVMLFSTRRGGLEKDLAAVGSKNGIFYASDRDTGYLVWSTRVGPTSGPVGGIMFSQAFDGERIYVGQSNGLNVPFTDVFGRNLTGGSWAALDPNTGVILWNTPEPTSARVYGPLTVTANGLLFGTSLSTTGQTHFAFDTLTGEILWSANIAGSFAAPVLYKNYLVWGSGYGLGAAKVNSFGQPLNATVFVMQVPHGSEYCD